MKKIIFLFNQLTYLDFYDNFYEMKRNGKESKNSNKMRKIINIFMLFKLNDFLSNKILETHY
jgi:hypothetical protein